MDWGRAKTYLILFFLALNLYLGLQVLEVRAQEAAWAWRPEAGAALPSPEERLEEVGIRLATALPAPSGPLSLLRVEADVPDGDALALALFGEAVAAGEVERNAWTGAYQGASYRRGGETLTALRNGFLFFDREGPDPTGSAAGGSLREEAERFLDRLGGLPGDARFDGIEEVEGAHRVKWVQVYRGLPVFGGYLWVEVADGVGVRAMERIWHHPLGLTGERRPAMPPYEALISLASQLGVSRSDPVWVEGMQIGYYSSLYDWPAIQWEMTPVWRITLRDRGQPFYVNAYTGRLER